MNTRQLPSILRRSLTLGALAAIGAVLVPACGSDGSQGAAGDGQDGGPADGTIDGSSDVLVSPDGDHGDSANGDSSTGDGSLVDSPCGGEQVVAQHVPVNLLVIVDRSGSMDQTPAGFTSSKWVTLVGALKSSLGAIQDKMSVGLLFFPDPKVTQADGCGMSAGDSVAIGIDKGTSTVPLIDAALDAASSAPSGNTPTADALALAHRYFTTGAGAQLSGEKHVLLALDGGPNCNSALTCTAASCTVNIDRSSVDLTKSACPIDPNSCCGNGSDTTLNKSCLDDTRTEAQVASLTAAGVTTYVIGIPGSDLYAGVLDALAVAGGEAVSTTSPKYYEVADAQQLTDTLVSITTSLVKTCEFQLSTTPPDPDNVNVLIDGTVLPQGGDNGWAYDNSTDPPTIVIKGQTCQNLETQGAHAVTFEFGCPTVK